MTTQDTPLSERKAQARRIIAEPHLYHVCLGCESIAEKGMHVCINCGAYHWEESALMVMIQAILIGKRVQRSVTAKDLVS